jgi:hypothetical protein
MEFNSNASGKDPPGQVFVLVTHTNKSSTRQHRVYVIPKLPSTRPNVERSPCLRRAMYSRQAKDRKPFMQNHFGTKKSALELMTMDTDFKGDLH